MADVRQCLGIDVGSHSVRIAEILISQDKVRVKNLAEARLQLEPGMKESKRQSAIVSQVGALIKRSKMKARHAVFCVPGQTVFVRRLRLPATSPDRLARIIRFEAREQIPFPLEKTVLEYQVFKSEVENEVEVLLVAIKREFIDGFMKMVQRIGLKVLSISVSSLALHNFGEVNACPRPLIERTEAGESAKKKAKGGGLKLKRGRKAEAETKAAEESAPYESMELEEIQAQVNLGATIMDLSLPKAGAERLIGFTRSVPVAGHQIDRAIASKLSLASLEEAHKIKETQCAILASDFEISGDVDAVNMPACEAATGVVDRIVAEIRRSLDFFLSQPDGVAVDSIVLSGGLARMSFLSNYIEEKMGLPVETASIKNPQIEIGEELAEKVASFAIPLGLAYQGLGVAQINIDFLPQDIKNLREFKNKRPQLAAAAALLAVTTALSCQTGNRYADMYARAAETFRVEQLGFDQQHRSLIEAKQVNQSLASEFEGLAVVRPGEFTPEGLFINHRRFALDVSLSILRSRPPDVLIESIDIENNGKVLIQGVAPKVNSVNVFLSALVDPKNQPFVWSATITFIDVAGRPHPKFQSMGNVNTFTIEVSSGDRKERRKSMKLLQAPSLIRGAPGEPGGDVLSEFEEFIRSRGEAQGGGGLQQIPPG